MVTLVLARLTQGFCQKHFIEFSTILKVTQIDGHSKILYLPYAVYQGLNMKYFYSLIFFFLISSGFGQDASNKGDIDGFKIYPNPVTEGRVYIITASNSPKKVRIFDVLGTPVLETTIQGKELNLNGLNAGVYLIQVFEKDKVATRKLIVK